MPIAAAIPAIIGGAASLGSAAIQSNAAGQAAKSAQQAADKNLAFQNQVYTNAQGDLNPVVDRGNAAGSALAGLLGTGGDPAASQAAFNNFLNSTNYKFQLGQGLEGIQYANAPAFNSGATGKALNNYAQGMAGSAINGYEGMLSGQQGLGVQAGSALAGVGTNIASQNASAVNSAATAQGNADFTTGNGFSNALQSILGKAANNSSFITNAFSGGNSAQNQIANNTAAFDANGFAGLT